MKKKVWVVSFRQRESGVYYPLLVVDNTGDIKSAIADWNSVGGLGAYWESKGFDLSDNFVSQVAYYG